MVKIAKKTPQLQACCAFTELMTATPTETELERDLVGLLWSYLAKQEKLCPNCQ